MLYFPLSNSLQCGFGLELGFYLSLCAADQPESLVPRQPSLFFTPGGLSAVRRRLKRLANAMQDYTRVDDLYEEILDCFLVCGQERRHRAPRLSSAPAWITFVPESMHEVGFSSYLPTRNHLFSTW
jgi:hypothetical protein